MIDLIAKVKRRLPLLEKALIIDYIEASVEQIADFTRQSEAYIYQNNRSIIVELVVIKANRKGNEGLQSVSTNGVNESYELDIPTPLKKQLYRHRRMLK